GCDFLDNAEVETVADRLEAPFVRWARHRVQHWYGWFCEACQKWISSGDHLTSKAYRTTSATWVPWATWKFTAGGFIYQGGRFTYNGPVTQHPGWTDAFQQTDDAWEYDSRDRDAVLVCFPPVCAPLDWVMPPSTQVNINVVRPSNDGSTLEDASRQQETQAAISLHVPFGTASRTGALAKAAAAGPPPQPRPSTSVAPGLLARSGAPTAPQPPLHAQPGPLLASESRVPVTPPRRPASGAPASSSADTTLADRPLDGGESEGDPIQDLADDESVPATVRAAQHVADAHRDLWHRASIGLARKPTGPIPGAVQLDGRWHAEVQSKGRNLWTADEASDLDLIVSRRCPAMARVADAKLTWPPAPGAPAPDSPRARFPVDVMIVRFGARKGIFHPASATRDRPAVAAHRWYRIDKAPSQVQRYWVWAAIQEAFSLHFSPQSLWGTALPLTPYALAFRSAGWAEKEKADSIPNMAAAAGALRAQSSVALGYDELRDPDGGATDPLVAPVPTDDEVEQCSGRVFQRILPGPSLEHIEAIAISHRLNPSQTRAPFDSLSSIVLLMRGPPGTRETETIAALLDVWIPAVPRGVAIGLFSRPDRGADLPAACLASAARQGQLSPASAPQEAVIRGAGLNWRPATPLSPQDFEQACAARGCPTNNPAIGAGKWRNPVHGSQRGDRLRVLLVHSDFAEVSCNHVEGTANVREAAVVRDLVAAAAPDLIARDKKVLVIAGCRASMVALRRGRPLRPGAFLEAYHGPRKGKSIGKGTRAQDGLIVATNGKMCKAAGEAQFNALAGSLIFHASTKRPQAPCAGLMRTGFELRQGLRSLRAVCGAWLSQVGTAGCPYLLAHVELVALEEDVALALVLLELLSTPEPWDTMPAYVRLGLSINLVMAACKLDINPLKHRVPKLLKLVVDVGSLKRGWLIVAPAGSWVDGEWERADRLLVS
ncbi:unnamed protein product, partial [Prorocentrum cordatum]